MGSIGRRRGPFVPDGGDDEEERGPGILEQAARILRGLPPREPTGILAQVDRILRGLPREEPTGILAQAERKIRESQEGWQPAYLVPPPDDKVTFSNSPPGAYSVDAELAAEVSDQGTPILPAPMWPRDWDDTSRIRYMGPKTIREAIYGPEERKMPTTAAEGKIWPSPTAAGFIEHGGTWKYEARTGLVIVGQGDTLWGVARDLTGSGANYKLIFAREFWETIIRPGQKIPLNMVQGVYRDWTKKTWDVVVVDMSWEQYLAQESSSGSSREQGPKPTSLRVSDKGKQFIKDCEGLRLEPYNGQTGKRITRWTQGATIGYGHEFPEEDWPKFKDGISEDEANRLFDRDIPRFAAAVNALVNVELKQHQFDALVALAFNIGYGPDGLGGSTVLKMVNDPEYKSSEYKDLESAWKAWKKSGGRVMRGLINRRADEWELYSSGDYRRDH